MSATSVVEKATSDMLLGPDWALNLDLCDAINNEPSQAKDIVRAVKKRLGNRNPQVQLLALTILETLIKNCGDSIHQQVAEKDVLHELVKLVKKKADMRVRDKTLVLLDSWQEAFGGASGRYPQYYMAYNELLKAGVEFPLRSGEAASPIFTPPQSQPLASPRSLYQHQSRSSGPSPPRSEDTEFAGMSLQDIKNAQNLVELLQDMVLALNPRDRMSAKEEVIVELVDQCRLNQHRVMQLVNISSDEELLCQGLALNDELQRVLARYDAFLSGAPIPETSVESKTRSQQTSGGNDNIPSPNKVQSPNAPQEPGVTSRPRNSARTIYSAVTLPPPPSSKKSVPQNSNVVSPRPADPTLDLLSGDLPPTSQPATSSSDSLALTVIEQPQQRSPVDLLALPAPEGFSNPFESAPFQATPQTEAVSPVYPSQSFQQNADTPLHRSENSWSTSTAGNQRQQSHLYGEVPTQPTVSGQPLQSQPQYLYQQQPVTTTPPPWQDDTRAQYAEQQWQAPPQASYPYTPQMWNVGQQSAIDGMQQYPVVGYTGYQIQPRPGQESFQSTYQGYPASNDLVRYGSGTGPGDNFGSQYLHQRGSAYGQSSSQQYSGTSKPLKSPDTLFDDLVDLRSMNAKFKAASLANKTSNTSKASPS
ncbi:TOM1-like protein 9 isoform X1 [Physcomitrium patens]|uniref:VHS domain-containing protein n=2 Tax=Physcomitrium patens TaxID=3218 RepID=A0A7I4CQX0_PHYPA|nr:TOM1-like protein 4 isoform X1 [Physcomitrium patens]XP_024362629.1 TOM1-like protein 4 isoform X1 [Physcomitrium patens]|eukprot:XP_024362628.1 TOM1-like protein 4 isoform X1 [Physcomitrella patens]